MIFFSSGSHTVAFWASSVCTENPESCCFEYRPETIYSGYKHLEISWCFPLFSSLLRSVSIGKSNSVIYVLLTVLIIYLDLMFCHNYPLWKLGFLVFPAPPLYMLSPSLNWRRIIISYQPSSPPPPPPSSPSFTNISSVLLCLYRKLTICLLAATRASVVAGIRFGLGRLNKSIRVLASVCCSFQKIELRSRKPLKTL